MNKLISFVCALLIFCAVQPAVAQDFQVPSNLTLKSAADYAKYEPDVLKCIEYLEKTPLGDADKRAAANVFLMTWVAGAPNVSVKIHSYLMPLVKENKDLLTIFIGGWTKYSLQHPENKDEKQFHLAALRDMIAVYTGSEGVEKADAMDEIVDAEKDGKLADWIDSHLDGK